LFEYFISRRKKRMGFLIDTEEFNNFLEKLSRHYRIYAPVNLKGKGRFSDTDSVRYMQVNTIEEIEFNKKSNFSPREVLLPITQTWTAKRYCCF
jgi:anaerobic sulfite reductase subunit A